jgi:hypothetical protein
MLYNSPEYCTCFARLISSPGKNENLKHHASCVILMIWWMSLSSQEPDISSSSSSFYGVAELTANFAQALAEILWDLINQSQALSLATHATKRLQYVRCSPYCLTMVLIRRTTWRAAS